MQALSEPSYVNLWPLCDCDERECVNLYSVMNQKDRYQSYLRLHDILSKKRDDVYVTPLYALL